LRSRDQAPVPSPLRKRTRSAINSRSSSRSSSVSQISNSSSRSKRARIVSPDRSECKVAKRKVAKTRSTRGKQGTSSPLVKTPPKRGRPLKRPRIKSPPRVTPPTSPAHPPEATTVSTPEQPKRTNKKIHSPPHTQAKVEIDREIEEVPIATIQTTKSSELEDEVVIASVSEPNLDDSCPTIEPDSSAHSQHAHNAYYPQSSNGHSSQYSSSSSSQSKHYSPLQFMRHVTPQTEAMKNRAAILPCKTRKTPEYTLVLDLDETLVHCSLCPLLGPERWENAKIFWVPQ